MASKYIGLKVDGYWQVVSCRTLPNRHLKYKLVNLFNAREVEVIDSVMKKLADGKTSVSKTIRRNIYR